MKTKEEIEEQLEKIRTAIRYFDQAGWSKKYNYGLRVKRSLEWVLGWEKPPIDDLPFAPDEEEINE